LTGRKRRKSEVGSQKVRKEEEKAGRGEREKKKTSSGTQCNSVVKKIKVNRKR
jgi:hypothetical protein